MSWKEFYNKLAYVYNLFDIVFDVQDYFVLKSLVEENRLTELKILQDIVKDKEINIVAIAIAAAIDSKLDILKWVTTLPRDKSKLLAEIQNVIGNVTTLADAIFISADGTMMRSDIAEYVHELRAWELAED